MYNLSQLDIGVHINGIIIYLGKKFQVIYFHNLIQL